jgi:hypothetical protein
MAPGLKGGLKHRLSAELGPPDRKKRVAEIPATRSFNEFAVAGETGQGVLAPDGFRPCGVRALLKPFELVHYGRISA